MKKEEKQSSRGLQKEKNKANETESGMMRIYKYI